MARADSTNDRDHPDAVMQGENRCFIVVPDASRAPGRSAGLFFAGLFFAGRFFGGRFFAGFFAGLEGGARFDDEGASRGVERCPKLYRLDANILQ